MELPYPSSSEMGIGLLESRAIADPMSSCTARATAVPDDIVTFAGESDVGECGKIRGRIIPRSSARHAAIKDTTVAWT